MVSRDNDQRESAQHLGRVRESKAISRRKLPSGSRSVQLAPAHLQATGWLLFEHGWQQADAVAQLLREQGFEQVQSWRDLGGQLRVTGGQWRG